MNYPPYLFEVVLCGPVEKESSVAVIENGFVLFKLKKENSGLWGQLCSNLMGNKQFSFLKLNSQYYCLAPT